MMNTTLFELALLLFIILSGANTLVYTGMKINGWLAPMGLILGIAQLVTVNLLQTVLLSNSNSTLTLVLVLLATAVMTIRKTAKLWKKAGRKPILAFIGVLTGMLTVSALLSVANLVKFHYDSYLYLITGRYVYTDNLEQLPELYLKKRYGLTPIIHSFAEINSQLYLRSITFLSGLASMMMVAYVSIMGFRSSQKMQYIVGVVSVGILALFTNSNFDFHSFYINGHMFFAMLLLTFVGAGWLIVNNKDNDQGNALVLLQCFSIVAAVFTRPEGGIIMGAALLPFALSSAITANHKRIIMITYGFALLLERLVLVSSPEIDATDLLGKQQLLFILIGVASIALGLINHKISKQLLNKYRGMILLGAEASIWLLLSLYMLVGESGYENIAKSLNSFYFNFVIGDGGWSGYIIVLMLLAVLVSLFKIDTINRYYIRFAVTTFIPLSLLIGIFRGAGYRVGHGDSFNRAVLHVLPTALLFIIVTILMKTASKKKALGS